MSPARFLLPAAIIAVAVAPAGAQQQAIGGLGFQLSKAVKDNDSNAFYKITRENARQLNAAVLDYQSDGETALQIAVRTNRNAYVNDLLYFGADPNVVGGKGDTALTTAVALRNIEVVELLIRGRAQVDLANRRGETPLIKAVQIRDLGLVQLLLQKGANPDKTDFSGKTAREYAAADNRYPAITKALAEAPKRSTRAVAGPKLN